MKLYRLIEGKFILLQDEADDVDDGEEDDNEDEDDTNPESSSTASRHSIAASDSDRVSETDDMPPPLSDTTILANKKASPYFRGLHRSKGIFWLATRPSQMGSWSTAGAMLTLGSEMPWFTCTPESEWNADADTVAAIKRDFKGAWGDRRQEIVFIGEQLDVEGLTGLLDKCLLNRAEMRRWERIMKDGKIREEEREEVLCGKWDEGLWAEWPRMGEEGQEEHEHQGHGHGHGHKH